MPKLNKLQIIEKLSERLNDLRIGKEVAARDLRALLTDEQVAVLDAAWAEQQIYVNQNELEQKRKNKALGWRSKREIQIEVLEQVVRQADDQMLEVLDELQEKTEIRQARIFLESYSKARAAGKSEAVARTLANNDLTRAGLRRADGKVVGHYNQRDRAVWELENKLRERQKAEMSAEELEQIELLEAHDRAWANKLKKQK